MQGKGKVCERVIQQPNMEKLWLQCWFDPLHMLNCPWVTETHNVKSFLEANKKCSISSDYLPCLRRLCQSASSSLCVYNRVL